MSYGLRRKLKDKMRRKRREVQQLEEDVQKLTIKIAEAHAYIQALEDTLQQVPGKEDTKDNVRSMRPGSLAYNALMALRREGQALHITALLEAIGKEASKKNRHSLTSSLGLYVRDGEVFTRPAPNTFGLREWGQAEKDDKDESELPEDFGLIVNDERK